MTANIKKLDLRDFVQAGCVATTDQLRQLRANAFEIISEIDEEISRRRSESQYERPYPEDRLKLIEAACRAVSGFWDGPRHADIIMAGMAAAGRDGLSVREIVHVTGIPTKAVENTLERAMKDGKVHQLHRKRWQPQVCDGKRRRRHHIWVGAEHRDGQRIHKRERR